MRNRCDVCESARAVVIEEMNLDGRRVRYRLCVACDRHPSKVANVQRALRLRSATWALQRR